MDTPITIRSVNEVKLQPNHNFQAKLVVTNVPPFTQNFGKNRECVSRTK